MLGFSVSGLGSGVRAVGASNSRFGVMCWGLWFGIYGLGHFGHGKYCLEGVEGLQEGPREVHPSLRRQATARAEPHRSPKRKARPKAVKEVS